MSVSIELIPCYTSRCLIAVTGQNGNRWSLATIRIGKYQRCLWIHPVYALNIL